MLLERIREQTDQFDSYITPFPNDRTLLQNTSYKTKDRCQMAPE